jgi:hypothetical protein
VLIIGVVIMALAKVSAHQNATISAKFILEKNFAASISILKNF